MITVYRLFAPWRDPWDATGAFKRGGRWNSPGRGVLYTASSLPLACLEVLVHIRDVTNVPQLSYSTISIPDRYIVRWTIEPTRTEAILESDVLSKEWGDRWLMDRTSPVTPIRYVRDNLTGSFLGRIARSKFQYRLLPMAVRKRIHSHLSFQRSDASGPVHQVPSVVIPQEWNYLIDPEAWDTKNLWADPQLFHFDPRVVDPSLRKP